MQRGTRFLTAAALAISGISFSFTVPASAQNPGTAGRTESPAAASVERAAMLPAEVRGVQDLFARATDVALLPNGLTGLESMIAPQTQPAGQLNNPSATAPAAPANPPSGTNGGTAATSETMRTTSQASRTARALNPDATRTAAESRELSQLVQQIRQQWRQKYKQDFRINNQAKVYADITASDLRGQAQTAGSRISGNPATRPANQPPMETQASPIDVRVPAVADTKPVQVQVISGPAQTFQFSSAAPVNRQQLAKNLQNHLQMLEQQQLQWPADVNEAYRLVSQHVLTAIAESTGQDRNAIPAADHQRGSGTSHVEGIRGTTAQPANAGSSR